MKRGTIPGLSLEGLRLAPAQVWGGLRLLPLIRDEVPGDLRLALRRYGETATVVELDARHAYCSYVPHALVVGWGRGAETVSSFGGRLQRTDGRRFDLGPCSVRVTSRMVRREDKQRLRLLPLHLALEGFLALHFGGPDVGWSEYSDRALRRGLSPRAERSFGGRSVDGLEDALRVFEIHEGQCGVLLYVADVLAAAFVVSHPDDYRALHRSLIEDCYGELVWRYSGLYDSVGSMAPTLEVAEAGSLDDLRVALGELRAEWGDLQRYLADELFSRELSYEQVYELGPFALQRFFTDFRLDGCNHIGECILRKDGTVEYLKTYRLSAAQTRRAFLLQRLSRTGWDLQAAADALGQSKAELIRRLESAGFGYLLKPGVLEAARRRR